MRTIFFYLFFLFVPALVQAQEEGTSGTLLQLLGGPMNYQGDLQPNSVTFQHSRFAGGIGVRQPLSRWFSVRAAFVQGRIEAADQYNRGYLVPRNLSFYTRISELSTGLEVQFLNLAATRFTPYLGGGVAFFHFDPYTFDRNGRKVYLQPLGTEGQGLPEYPTRKLYQKSQLAFTISGGLRVAVSNSVSVGVEMNQRKTFTDYLDDVSNTYPNLEVLQQRRGALAAEMSYRGGELPGGNPTEHEGSVRGTPTEKDWYYFGGLNVEIKMRALRLRTGRGGNQSGRRRHDWYNSRCPKVF